MTLKVMYRGTIVGNLSVSDQTKMVFEYSQEWMTSKSSFPISHSLPLSGNYIRGIKDHNFFSNLLPEAAARQSICRDLGISADNDFELLKAIGGECAGALQISPERIEQHPSNSYEKISEETLKKSINSIRSLPRLKAGGIHRLSLAGAQDKWPVYYNKSTLYWPEEGSPSSHILKFINSDYKELNWNESYTTFLASCLGLQVMDVSIHNGYSLVRRYDRIPDSNGEIERLHQEDFCQALGYSSFTKYESEKGPEFAECIKLVRKISTAPLEDVANLIHWQILNLLLGNSDGHAKNLSILYTKKGIRLAPFYDLVCTRIYKGISPDLAFSIGGVSDPGHIGKKDWGKMAEELEISPRYIFRILAGFLNDLDQNLGYFHEQFIQKSGDNPILNRINQLIKKQIRRTRTLLN